MKKAIYTVIIGDYDKLHPAPNQHGWDCYLYTDQNFPDSMGWCIIPVPVSKNPKLDSRRYKILSHNYLPDYDLVCYIDANYTVIGKLPDKPTRFLHGKRGTVEQEAKELLRQNKETRKNIDYLRKYILASQFKDDRGLFQNGFFIRKHDQQSNLLHNDWFWFCELMSHRDQLTLPIVLSLTGLFFTNILPNKDYHNYFKRVSNHK